MVLTSEKTPLAPVQANMDDLQSLGTYVVDMELSSGPKQAERLVVFFPGWPDTRELFDPWLDTFKAKFAVLSVTIPGMERPPFEPHPDWPHDGYPWPTFYPMLHKFLQEQRMKLLQRGVKIKEVNIVGHDFGALHAHALDWLYPGCYSRIVALDVGPVLGSFDGKTNAIVSCYQTQFSRYHMGNPCVHCPCFAPVWVKNWIGLGGAPQPLMDRPSGSWMASSEFWMYSQMYSHSFSSTFGLCACCCCTPCALGCCKSCSLKYSTEIYDLNSDETYLEHRAAKDHNMFLYSSPIFANPDFISLLGEDAIEFEGGHWFLVPESKGGVATPETVQEIGDNMIEFLGRA